MLVFVKESTDGKRKKAERKKENNRDRTQTKLSASLVRGIMSRY